jgi:hypothetical protein
MEVFTNGEEVPKGNLDQVLQDLEANDFTAQPISLNHEPSVNYLKSFEEFANSTIKPFSKNNSQSRPMSGLTSSKSTTFLKKSSVTRCKTSINRNTVSYSNLGAQGQCMSSNRGNGFMKQNGKSVMEEIENEDDETGYMDFNE